MLLINLILVKKGTNCPGSLNASRQYVPPDPNNRALVNYNSPRLNSQAELKKRRVRFFMFFLEGGSIPTPNPINL